MNTGIKEEFIMKMYAKNNTRFLLSVIYNQQGTYTEEEVDLARMFLDKLQEDGCGPLPNLARCVS